jgi:hypothetical protein
MILTPQLFFLFIPINLFLHEMEEWNIVRFHKENYTQEVDENNLSERLWLFMLSIIGMLFSVICFNIGNPIIANSVFLVLVTFLIINGLQHILLSISLRKYNPGLFFGGIVGTTIGVLYDIILVRENIVPLWIFISITTIWLVPTTIDTIISRKHNKLPNMIIQILIFSRYVEKKMSE